MILNGVLNEGDALPLPYVQIVRSRYALAVALSQMGVKLPDVSTAQWILYISPVVIAAIFYLSYRISCGIFGKKDL